MGDGQETHRGPAIRLGAGETTQRRGGQVLTDGKSRHRAVLQPPRHLALLHPIHKFKLLWAGISPRGPSLLASLAALASLVSLLLKGYDGRGF
jgi:hypothetical protein